VEPTAEPTVEPTAEPTVEPTAEPTVEPTAEPTVEPTAEPTVEPTAEPTEAAAAPTAEPNQPGFDFGSGCGGGDGAFDLELPVEKASVTVGTIPAGKFDVVVNLDAEADIDVSLFDASETSLFAEGKAIVQWCKTSDLSIKNCGILRNREEASDTYKGMRITYSGYNGVDGKKGKEFIRIEGATTVPITVRAYAFKIGEAKVDYSWQASRTDCCLGVANACGGSFEATLFEKQVVTIGTIPTGKKDLRVVLQSTVDIDIQLYDQDATTEFAEGTAIIAYCEKPCNYGEITSARPISGEYEALTYSYSGWNGDQTGGKGNEFIQIDGVTNRNLLMTFYGFKAGSATVTYTYTEPTDEAI